MSRYFTGRPCKWGHVAERRSSDRKCLECERLRFANPSAAALRAQAKYRRVRAERRNELNAARRARGRVPLSAEEKHEIRGMYAAAKMLAAIHRIPFEVDHKIPLHGKTVSGLHVLRNLQILPAGDNKRKSNSFEERGFE